MRIITCSATSWQSLSLTQPTWEGTENSLCCPPALPEGRAPTCFISPRSQSCEHLPWEGGRGGRARDQSGPAQRAAFSACLPSLLCAHIPATAWHVGRSKPACLQAWAPPQPSSCWCALCILTPHSFCAFSSLSLDYPSSHFPS